MPVLLLLLALAPAYCAPAAAVRADPQRAYFCEDIDKPFFAETSPGVFRSQRPQSMPVQFRLPKPAGIKRVFVLGESVAALLDRGEIALHGKKWSMLDSLGLGGLAAPGAGGLEIINCGMGGYESVRIYRVLREILAYGPDLVVILSGNQEGSRGQDCPGMDFMLRRADLRLYERLYSLGNDPQQAWKKASLRFHSGMLKKMAEAAKKAGVPVVFCTLPANYADMPSRNLPQFTSPQFSEGYKLFYERRYQEAYDRFSAGLAVAPRDHFLHYYAGKALQKLGRDEEAAGQLLEALDYDSDMTRASPARNAAIRRAAEEQGACVADLEKFFAGLAPGGLPGFGLFTDGMHWRTALNKAVWDEIFRSAAACGLKGYGDFRAADSAGWKETAREDARKRLSYAVSWISTGTAAFSEASLAELAYIRQGQPEILKEAAVSPEALDKLLLKNFWSIGLTVRIRELFPYFLGHLAENERRAGDPAAGLKLCGRALALAPEKTYLLFLRAQLQAGLGDRDAAGRSFRESGLDKEVRGLAAAYGFSPAPPAQGPAATVSGSKPPGQAGTGSREGIDALMRLCASTAAAGGAQRSLAACQEAISSLGPGMAGPGQEMLASEASLESSRLLESLGRDEEARETLFWCVSDAPAGWPRLPEARKLLENLQEERRRRQPAH